MRLAIPVNEDQKTLCLSFGRTPLFAIIDTETNQTYYLNNSAIAAQGGAGIKAAQTLVDEKIEVLLTPRCGENAAEVLQAAHIKIYRATNDCVEDQLKAYRENQLSVLETIHKGFHHHGGQ